MFVPFPCLCLENCSPPRTVLSNKSHDKVDFHVLFQYKPRSLSFTTNTFASTQLSLSMNCPFFTRIRLVTQGLIYVKTAQSFVIGSINHQVYLRKCLRKLLIEKQLNDITQNNSGQLLSFFVSYCQHNITLKRCKAYRHMIEMSLKNLKRQQRTKRGESFHKHAGAAILPTDTLKTPNFCTKKAPRLVLVNIPVPAQRGTF